MSRYASKVERNHVGSWGREGLTNRDVKLVLEGVLELGNTLEV